MRNLDHPTPLTSIDPRVVTRAGASGSETSAAAQPGRMLPAYLPRRSRSSLVRRAGAALATTPEGRARSARPLRSANRSPSTRYLHICDDRGMLPVRRASAPLATSPECRARVRRGAAGPAASARESAGAGKSCAVCRRRGRQLPPRAPAPRSTSALVAHRSLRRRNGGRTQGRPPASTASEANRHCDSLR